MDWETYGPSVHIQMSGSKSKWPIDPYRPGVIPGLSNAQQKALLKHPRFKTYLKNSFAHAGIKKHGWTAIIG
ncbi:hypothetical protein [Bowdeniella massiliensis]|uniref:hypothetical protein n=1 Tax=Bowdeniella massiliensis TaxID=2932264 RepID=UPI0020283756|nr:hypothetical protein [Bowdeniella massiliensis]